MAGAAVAPEGEPTPALGVPCVAGLAGVVLAATGDGAVWAPELAGGDGVAVEAHAARAPEATVSTAMESRARHEAI